MTRQEATQDLRDVLNSNKLNHWHIRLNQNVNSHFLGLCSHRDETIILSAHHIDIHPTPDVKNTNRHEVAHALTPGHGHDEVWAAKAKELGCDNTSPCSNLSLSPDIIDAIRSGADVEITFTEQVIRTPKYSITRLQDKCPFCHKVAKTIDERLVISASETSPDLKFIRLECGHQVVKKIPKGTPFHTFQYGGDPKCKHEWDKNECQLCGRFRPYNFQIEGMRFGEAALAVNNGVAIFDDMGLGKTIQAEGLVYFHQEICDPCLWVVKSPLKFQTSISIIHWMGPKFVPQIIQSSKDWLISGLKNYIIGYDMLVPKTRTMKSGKVVNQGFDITQFDRVGIKCVVLDECQQIKNVNSSRTQMVRRVVKGRKVIALSGTPWNNKGSEFFPVLNMLDPMKFHSEEKFKRDWVDYWWDGSYRKEAGIRRIPAFKEFTKDIIIRRERPEVMPELPLVNRTKLHINMTPQQEETYDDAVQEFVDWYEQQLADISGMHILAMMAKMRHLVAIAKIPATVDYVDEFVEDTDRKLVVFVHHIAVGEIIHQELTERFGAVMPILHLVGGMQAEKRHALVTEFNSAKRALMVASTLSSGEGLNLQTCADCVIHERQWNPGKEEQAEGRFIRIGQTAEHVNAVYTHMEGLTTIDPQMDARNERKRAQYHAAMNKGEVPRWNEDAEMRELADSIVRAHNAKKNRKLVNQ